MKTKRQVAALINSTGLVSNMDFVYVASKPEEQGTKSEQRILHGRQPQGILTMPPNTNTFLHQPAWRRCASSWVNVMHQDTPLSYFLALTFYRQCNVCQPVCIRHHPISQHQHAAALHKLHHVHFTHCS